MSYFSLKGEYVVDIYDPKGELKSTKTYPNFITSTGLSYIYDTSVASCFSYLSLGSGTSANNLSTTTGLDTVIPSYSYLGQSNYVNNACGTTENLSGITLYRAWNISGIGSGGLNIGEIMVSPTNQVNNNPSGKAFSRITGSIVIPSGDYSVITYKLNISVPTGVYYFENIINTNNAITVGPPDPCTFWDQLSGAYSLIHHGLKTISANGTIQSNYGPYLEPSISDALYLRAYLSTDNLEFEVNQYNGGPVDDGFSGYSGICTFKYDFHSAKLADTKYGRINRIRKGYRTLPSTGDYLNPSFSTISYFENENVTLYPLPYTATDRSRSLSRLYTWPRSAWSDGVNYYRAKSLVFSYGSDLPFADCLFYSTGGYLTGDINTTSHTINMSNLPSDDYFFKDVLNVLDISTKITWSAPCPSDVVGCS